MQYGSVIWRALTKGVRLDFSCGRALAPVRISLRSDGSCYPRATIASLRALTTFSMYSRCSLLNALVSPPAVISMT